MLTLLNGCQIIQLSHIIVITRIQLFDLRIDPVLLTSVRTLYNYDT
jgi:hypothetical protein